MVEGTIAIIEYANAIPEFGILLWVWQEVQSLLVSGIRLLEVILHEVAVPWEMPG